MPSKIFSSLLASVGRPTIKVEGQPPRIWEISSDWSSYRNGMYRTIEQALSPFSTRRLFSREATFSFVGVAYHISKCDADKGKKSRFARKKSPSGKWALVGEGDNPTLITTAKEASPPWASSGPPRGAATGEWRQQLNTKQLEHRSPVVWETSQSQLVIQFVFEYYV